MAAGALAAGPIGATVGAMVAALASASLPAPTSAAWTLCAAGTSGAMGAYTAPAMASGSVAGRAAPIHDAQWFERIHVIPRAYDVGQIVGDRSLPVEVWNGYRRNFRLWDIEVVGDSAVFYDGPTPPTELQTFASDLRNILIFSGGTGHLEALVTWRFRIRTGASTYVPFATPGSDVEVTGERTLLFTARPNGLAGVRERYGYPTNVIAAWNGGEQRVQLKSRPRRNLSFTPTLVDPAEALEVVSKLYLTGGGLFAVPFWPDAAKLTADVAVNATTVFLDTTGRAFVAGGSALLWRDQWTAESVPIAEVLADRLNLAGLVANPYPAAGSVCVPLEPMRLLEAPSLSRQGSIVSELPVAFSGEGV